MDPLGNNYQKLISVMIVVLPACAILSGNIAIMALIIPIVAILAGLIIALACLQKKLLQVESQNKQKLASSNLECKMDTLQNELRELKNRTNELILMIDDRKSSRNS